MIQIHNHFFKIVIECHTGHIGHILSHFYCKGREAFANISDPTISEVLLTSLEEAVKNGYDGLFRAALAVSILMLLATIILGLIRSQKQPAIKEKGGDDHGAQAAD